MTTVKRKSKQLGQILIELGYITPEQLESALEEHRKTPKSLGRVLIDLGMIKESDLVRALAEQVGLEFVDLSEFPVDATATVLVPESLARRYRRSRSANATAVSLVAMADPVERLRARRHPHDHGPRRPPVVATANDVEHAIQKFSGLDTEVDAMVEHPRPRRATPRPRTDLEAALEDAPIVKFVNLLMTQAVGDRASDIHVEPAEHDLRIRFRIDGVLHEVMPPAPKNIQAGLISRLKVMADINIAERRIPQDGRISMKVGGNGARPACRDAADGLRREGRHAHPRQGSRRCCASRTSASSEDRTSGSRSSFRKPYGAILVTGPTGSGKSTTLYATLNILNEQRPQHHHRRGPGRVPAGRRQPGADQPEGRAHVRLGAALDPARRPRHRARR